jgi:hypothetical protein
MALVSDKHVTSAATFEQVMTSPSVDEVVAPSAEEAGAGWDIDYARRVPAIVAEASCNVVVPPPTTDRIGAPSSTHDVVSAASNDDVKSPGTDDAFAGVRANDRGLHPVASWRAGSAANGGSH